MCAQLRAAGVETVDLLPFHRMGIGKYEAMGLSYAYADVQPLSQGEIARIESIYKQYFTVKIER